MKNFVQDGKSITLTATAAYVSGGFVLEGALFGVATTDAAIGESVTIATSGVFNLPKKAADTPAQGANAYWDNTNKEFTTTNTGNTLVGHFMAAYTGGTTAADIRLKQ